MKAVIIVSIFLAATIFAPLASATKDGDKAVEISDEQASLISQNCGSIKIQLQQLQRADAKSRVHIGAQYETVSSNLMLNLSIRLAKNDLANATIATEQSKFVSERKVFRESYIEYSQALEKLISVNCKDAPQEFYGQLKTAQAARANVDKSVKRLNEIISEHRKTVKTIQSGLEK